MLLEALNEPDLFGLHFRDDTWGPHRMYAGEAVPTQRDMPCLACRTCPSCERVFWNGNNQEFNDVSESDRTFEEMARIVDSVRESDFYDRQLDQREWEAEQRAKAVAILGLLRQHLPVQAQQEAEGVLSTSYGCQCICNLLQREQDRRAVLAELPEAESEEIENFLDTGVWRSKDELAKRRAERKAMIDREELPF